jgi:S-phase kinase-associated protein 1|tara:strand:- start:534 stop:1127 length:594 start_codon:yes stop_codon:yes gene_type:complete
MLTHRDASKDDDAVEDVVILRSFENESIEVESKVACVSRLVRTMVVPSSVRDEPSELQTIALPNVKAVMLRKVLEFCKHELAFPMVPIKRPLPSTNLADCRGLSEWHIAFVDFGGDESGMQALFEMILAANYMDVKKLLELCCAKLASLIKGKTPAEIENVFAIEDIFGDAEAELEDALAEVDDPSASTLEARYGSG